MAEPTPPTAAEIAEWKDMYGHHSLEAMPYRQHVLRLIAHTEVQQRRIEKARWLATAPFLNAGDGPKLRMERIAAVLDG